MTDKQWNDLNRTIKGEVLNPLPVGFIIDCPWLPNWYGISILDYFTNDKLWLDANLKALNDFPEVMFLPGFWSEYGMCTEPSAFGARCSFPGNEFPHAHPVISSSSDIDDLIMNILGGIIGFSFYAFLQKVLKGQHIWEHMLGTTTANSF